MGRLLVTRAVAEACAEEFAAIEGRSQRSIEPIWFPLDGAPDLKSDDLVAIDAAYASPDLFFDGGSAWRFLDLLGRLPNLRWAHLGFAGIDHPPVRGAVGPRCAALQLAGCCGGTDRALGAGWPAFAGEAPPVLRSFAAGTEMGATVSGVDRGRSQRADAGGVRPRHDRLRDRSARSSIWDARDRRSAPAANRGRPSRRTDPSRSARRGYCRALIGWRSRPTSRRRRVARSMRSGWRCCLEARTCSTWRVERSSMRRRWLPHSSRGRWRAPTSMCSQSSRCRGSSPLWDLPNVIVSPPQLMGRDRASRTRPRCVSQQLRGVAARRSAAARGLRALARRRRFHG